MVTDHCEKTVWSKFSNGQQRGNCNSNLMETNYHGSYK